MKRMLKVATYMQVLIMVLAWINSSLCMTQIYSIWPSINNCFSRQSCLTLEEFATHALKNASAKSIELTLAPGNHSLSSELSFKNLEYLLLNATSDTEETRIICNSFGQLSLLNIRRSQINGIEFLECKNNTVMELKNLIINNCTFSLGGNGSSSLLELKRTTVLFRNSSFYIINTRNRYDSVQPALLSHASIVKIEASELTINGTTILLAESKSTIHLKSTSISNSTTGTAWHDQPSTLIQISNGKLLIEDSNIIKNKGEKIVYVRQCNVQINNSIFNNNFGADCILCIVKSKVLLNNTLVSGNHGNFSVIYLLKTGTNITGRMTYSNNFGSLLIINSNVQFYSLTMFEKCSQSHTVSKIGQVKAKGALTTIQSTIVFWKNVTFIDNNSTYSGSAIYSSESKITIYYYSLIANNIAEKSGGGAFLYLSTFICHGNCIFTGNIANKSGGGIHAVSSVIALSNDTQNDNYNTTILRLSFVANEAERGGALFFELNSYIKCIVDRINNYSIIFDGNIARTDGGAIFIRDETYFTTCKSKSSFVHRTRTECFFQIIYNDIDIHKSQQKERFITFKNNTADRGKVLYGGLLDRCSLSPMADIHVASTNKKFNISGLEYFKNESRGTVELNDIQSDAMRVCSCQDSGYFSCQNYKRIFVQKGEKFNIPIVVMDQVNRTIVNATIRSVLHEKSFLGEGQQLQHTEGECTNLTFNVSSPCESVNLTLYADQGPCKDKGISTFRVTITFKRCECAIGFLSSNESNRCECNLDPQLKGYITAFNTHSVVRIKNCWITYIFDGYIIHPNCPYDYCLPAHPTVGVMDLNQTGAADAQCNFNRTGLLCGQCKQGYSLSMSGSHCIPCPKYWPGLVIGNILTGIVFGIMLVFLLLFLNVTVALGTPNGVIFYANIVLINKSIFLPSSTDQLNFFTAVIYLLNTQMGMKRCFWEGMNAYGRTWFSYVFPLYMISLVLVIILISKYSLRCARLLGRRNPVATLATLILLSYAYFLRSILDILSFTIIKYPDETHKTVWLPDASVKYFQGKHIPLFLSAIILIIIGLAYTILLFTWQWLHRLPNIVIFRWLKSTKLNSFIEAYHAPFKPKYRYWTGLLLLIRIALSVAITANVSGDRQYNLLATGVLIACLIMFKVYLGDNIYKKRIIDCLENVCYLNLLLLTLVTFYSLDNQIVHKTATYTSIGVIFILSLCVITYHTYSALKNIKRCQNMCTLVIQTMKRHKTATSHGQSLELNTQTFNRCISTEVSMSAMDMSHHGKDEMTEKGSEKTYEAVVRTIEQDAFTPDSLIEPLL